jgi:hypothetical protein
MHSINSNSNFSYSNNSSMPPKKRIRFCENSEVTHTVNHLASGLITSRIQQQSTHYQSPSIPQTIVFKNQLPLINENDQRVIQSTKRILEDPKKSEKFSPNEPLSPDKINKNENEEEIKREEEMIRLDQLNEGYDLLDVSQSIGCLKIDVNEIFKNFTKAFFLKSKEIKKCKENYEEYHQEILNKFPDLKEITNFKDLEILLLFLAIKFSCHIEVTDLVEFLLKFDKKEEKKLYNFLNEAEDWLFEVLDLVALESKENKSEIDNPKLSHSALNLGKKIFNKEISYLEIKELFDQAYGSWVTEFNERPPNKEQAKIFEIRSFYRAGLPELKECHLMADQYVENILKIKNSSELTKKPYLDNLQIAALFLAFKFFSEGISLKKCLSALHLSDKQKALLTLEHCVKSEAWLLEALNWRVDLSPKQSVTHQKNST